MDLILVRHAQPERVDADAAPSAGSADPPLTPLGAVNAARVAAWLAHERIDHVVTSPLLRARQTAVPLAEMLGIEPEVVGGVGEFDARDRSYIPFEEVPRDHEKWAAMVEGRWADIDGWMDPDEFRAQVVSALEAVVAAHPGRRVAVFTHGGTINMYLAHVAGIGRHLWFYPAYASIHRVVASRDGVRSIRSVNETAHLDADRLAALVDHAELERQREPA